MRITKRGAVVFLTSAWFLLAVLMPLSGCGGGTSGSTPDFNDPSRKDDLNFDILNIRVFLFDESRRPLPGEPVLLGQSDQVKETNSQGIVNLLVPLKSRTEIVLTVAGEKITIDPDKIPKEASLVGIEAQLGDEGLISVTQREIQVSSAGECTRFMRRVNGIDFDVAAKVTETTETPAQDAGDDGDAGDSDTEDSDVVVPCSITMRQSFKGETDEAVVGWNILFSCRDVGKGIDVASVFVDADGKAKLDFELDRSKKGCRYSILPESNLQSPGSSSGDSVFYPIINIR